MLKQVLWKTTGIIRCSRCLRHGVPVGSLFNLNPVAGIQVSSRKTMVLKRNDTPLCVKTFSMHDPLLAKYGEHLVQIYEEAEQILNKANIAESQKKKSVMQLAQLGPAVKRLKKFQEKKIELDDLKDMAHGDDLSLASMAKSEIIECQEQLEQLNSEILLYLMPPELGDNNNVIFEVSAGVGGQEAMLFTEEILKMYMYYAAYKNWKFELISQDSHDIGAVRKASAIIQGEEVYKCLKYEGGVHRVQRVPRTEKTGRVHTSTMTVAIMPQPSDIDIVINPKDVKVDTFRASGAGGQHVNTTDSAVRMTHIPTGTVAECQVGRSQIKNREIALQVLRSRIYQKELEARNTQFRNQRRIQVGTAGRSEKIRTYNFNQDRITDHRIGENVHNIQDFLSGGQALEDMIEQLQEASRKERLSETVETWFNERDNR